MFVKIYKPAKSSMQSGRGSLNKWVLEYESTSRRAPESLMGWIEGNDTLCQVRLNFSTLEEAVAFAEKNGWEYIVSKSQERKVKPRNFADNFKYVPPEKHESA